MTTNTTHHPEAFARVLIDRALTDSNWDLLNSEVEDHYRRDMEIS